MNKKFYEINEYDFVVNGGTNLNKEVSKAHNDTACGVLYGCGGKKKSKEMKGPFGTGMRVDKL